jgi:ERCC4-related helicase
MPNERAALDRLIPGQSSRGRTGRFADGRILELITKNTLDETSLFISQRKEERMRAGITGMEGQKALS